MAQLQKQIQIYINKCRNVDIDIWAVININLIVHYIRGRRTWTTVNSTVNINIKIHKNRGANVESVSQKYIS